MSKPKAILYARVSTEAQAADDKTSLSEQLLALRKYADTNGYEIAEEIPEEISGRKQDTEGLERIRDLADSGKIDAVLVYKWNRLARTVARFESFMLEMKLTGVNVMSLDGQSNETASGRMFNRLMAVFSGTSATISLRPCSRASGASPVPGRLSRAASPPTASGTTATRVVMSSTIPVWKASAVCSAW